MVGVGLALLLATAADVTASGRLVHEASWGRIDLAAPGWMAAVGLSGDGRTLAGATHRAIAVWNLDTGQEKLVAARELPPETQLGVALSADGRRLLVLDKRQIEAWDTTTGKRSWAAPRSGQFGPVALSPDGRRAAISVDQKIQLWNADRGVLEREVEAWQIDRLRFVAGGARLRAEGTGGWPGHRRFALWDAVTGAPLWNRVEAGSGGCDKRVCRHIALRLSADGTRAAWVRGNAAHSMSCMPGNGHCEGHTWATGLQVEVEDVGLGGTRILGSPSPTLGFLLSDDGRRILLSGRHLELFDASTGARLWSIEPPVARDDLLLSPEARYIVTLSGGTVAAYRGSDGAPLWTRQEPFLAIPWAPRLRAFFAEELGVLVVVSGQRTVVRDLERGEEVVALVPEGPLGSDPLIGTSGAALLTGNAFVRVSRTPPARPAPFHLGRVVALAVSPDGQRVAAGGMEGSLIVWGGAAPVELPRQRLISDLDFAGDGRRLAVAALGVGRLWELPTSRLVAEQRFAGNDPWATRLIPGRQRVVFTSKGGSFQVHDLVSAKQVESWSTWRHCCGNPNPANFSLQEAALSSVGLVIARTDQLVLFRPPSARPLTALRLPRRDRGGFDMPVAISSDGKVALIGVDTGAAYLFALPEGHRLRTLVEAGPPVTAVALAGDAAVVATADGAVRLFDRRGREEGRLDLSSRLDYAFRLAVDPAARVLAVGTVRGRVHRFAIHPR